MNNFTYSIPTKIHFGKGQISHLSELSESGNKVLLCYGGGSIKKAGIYDEAVKILKEEDMEIFELSGIAPNPKIESVREGKVFQKIIWAKNKENLNIFLLHFLERLNSNEPQ